MTISQLLQRTIRLEKRESSIDSSYQALSLLRRCLIWGVIVLVASWIISNHVFAEELTPVPEIDNNESETSAMFIPDGTSSSEATPMQAGEGGAVPVYDYSGIFPPGDTMPGCATCAPACDVGPMGRYWFRTDYLLWWTKGSRVEPLVSTGTIGDPGTQILYGDTRYNLGSRSNVRIGMGMWFDKGRTFGVELDGFTLGKAGESRSFSSDGSTVLAQPYYNVIAAANASRMFAGDSGGYTYTGAMDARQSEYFQSLALSFRVNLACDCLGCGCGGCGDACGEGCSQSGFTRADLYAQRFCSRFGANSWRLDLITGWRTCRLNERTTLNATSFGGITSTEMNSWDSFKTQNEFNGGELGLLAQFYRGRWSLDVLAKVGLGNQNQAVTISGQTVINNQAYEGGMFALSSNIGHYDRDKFVAIPQIGFEFAYQLSCNLRATFGYNFIYWSNVVRSSEQISSQIDPTQIPPNSNSNATQPAFSWHDSDYWAQGLNFGLEARF